MKATNIQFTFNLVYDLVTLIIRFPWMQKDHHQSLNIEIEAKNSHQAHYKTHMLIRPQAHLYSMDFTLFYPWYISVFKYIIVVLENF